MNRDQDTILRCECGGNHFFMVTRLDDLGYLSLASEWEPRGWRDRVSQAWQALRGKRHNGLDVLLDSDGAWNAAQALTRAAISLKKMTWIEDDELEAENEG